MSLSSLHLLYPLFGLPSLCTVTLILGDSPSLPDSRETEGRDSSHPELAERSSIGSGRVGAIAFAAALLAIGLGNTINTREDYEINPKNTT